MALRTKGIIIREQAVRESDRLVTLLTADYGVLRAFVHGAKRLNSKLAATSLFCYCDFSIYQSKNAYIINEAEPIEVFFALREDILKLSLAQYFAQLTLELAEEEQNCNDFLRLVLNALYLLCKGEKHYSQIKAVVELRMLSMGGYMPNLLGCEACGKYESDPMYFQIQTGVFYCAGCHQGGGIPLNPGVFTAIRFICLSEVGKVFSFTLPEDSMAALSDAAERYLLLRIGRRFTTLDFYKSLL